MNADLFSVNPTRLSKRREENNNPRNIAERIRTQHFALSKDIKLLMLIRTPAFDSLRSDSRYRDLMKRLDLPE